MKAVVIFAIFGYLINNIEMAYLDVNSFFKVNGNLTKISWAHAVNNQTLLKEALNSTVMMLEADVVIGSLNGTNITNIPIMAHPPANTSDLSLEHFLNDVHTHNTQNNSKLIKKGVKLDFKTIEAVEASIVIIEAKYKAMNYPLWLNADILSGPHNATAIPVNPQKFFNRTSSFTNSTLSIGWTTNIPTSSNITVSYSNNDIEAMLETVKNNNVKQNITFPVRAGIAASSINQMKNLVSKVSNSTLTIWSSENDPVNVTNLRNLIREVGINRTFIDVPKSLENQLNLQSLNSASFLTPAGVIVFVSLVLSIIL